MILVKSTGSDERHKIYKYDLETEFTPEQVILIDEELPFLTEWSVI